MIPLTDNQHHVSTKSVLMELEKMEAKRHAPEGVT